jgi:hypothetical protein
MCFTPKYPKMKHMLYKRNLDHIKGCFSNWPIFVSSCLRPIGQLI